MKISAARLVTRSHATMEPVTTPDSPRNTWPARKVRIDDQNWKSARVKLAQESETWQAVMETLALGWLADEVDIDALRERLQARGLAPGK